MPKNKLREGIAVSLDKSQGHLDCSELLIKNNFLDNAVDTIELAIEEFGRAVYLRERLQAGLDSIENDIEKNHWLKYNKAFSLLPSELKVIFEITISPMYPVNYFPNMRGTISPFTRPNAIFTIYDEKTQVWRNGIMADGEKLMHIVKEIREYIIVFKF